MINAFTQRCSNLNARGLKAACLSLIPGLGQLYNRKINKALAFFLVDFVNLGFFLLVYGFRIPYIDDYTSVCSGLNTWSPASVPGLLLHALLFSYLAYAMFDAYRDAGRSADSDGFRELGPGLSQTGAASYSVHMAAFFGIYLLILFKILPACHFADERPQITVSFELEGESEEKARGLEGKPGELSKVDEKVHLKDPEKAEISPSRASKETPANLDADNSKTELASIEKESLSSKQVVSPNPEQSPRELASQGADEKAKKNTELEDKIKKQSELKQSAASPAPGELPEELKSQVSELPELAKTRLAMLPTPAAPSGFTRLVSDENTASFQKTLSSSSSSASNSGSQISYVQEYRNAGSAQQSAPRLASLPAPAPITASTTGPYAGLVQEPFSNVPAIVEARALPETRSQSNAAGPSMLGFMDSSLSEDTDMRAYWSEMSAYISRYVKANPLNAQGLAACSFSLNNYGQPRDIQFVGSRSMEAPLKNVLQQSPAMMLPRSKIADMHVQVKASSDAGGTFISVELNSKAAPLNEESLNDFKYQASLQSYLKGIKKSIYSSWKPPVQDGLKPVMIGFKVTTEGKVSQQHVVQSSGDPQQDQAALYAALSVTQWSQPPAGTAEDMDICMVLQKCKSCESENTPVAPAQARNKAQDSSQSGLLRNYMGLGDSFFKHN